MPQETNLNSFPYFDDFDKDKDFYKVLFKPSYPVQARELTTLQSILQNQIEQFGNHFFKEGSVVVPGQIGYIKNYPGIKLEDSYSGIPISSYIKDLLGAKIVGKTSGVTAEVKSVLMKEDSEINTPTLYLSYLNPSSLDNSSVTFLDGEDLVINSNITSSYSTLSVGSSFAKCISKNSNVTGSAFFINDGIYFIRGNFVNVSKETILLDQYQNNPSYRIGFSVIEDIITSYEDESLNDNAQGFYNYAAPGADRLKISVSLSKKSLTDFNDANFIELSVIENGTIKKFVKNSDYNLIKDYLAQRTYDESGDYYVKPFDVYAKNSLNDYKGNSGVYDPNSLTENGSNPSDSLGVYQVSSGKAYVKGYDVELISPTFIDFPKTRDTATIRNSSIKFKGASNLILNRVLSAPKVGIANTFVVSLMDSRLGSDSTVATGTTIGVSRVYDFSLNSNAYNTNSSLNQWKLSLFDYNFYSTISLNSAVSYNKSTHVKGASSGASGFLVYNVTSSTNLTVIRNSGEFLLNEKLLFNGIDSGKIVTSVRNYKDSDVKSVYGLVSTGVTFTGDTVLSASKNFGLQNFSISSSGGGISTVYSPNVNFIGIVTTGNIISYTTSASTVPVYNKVVSVGINSIQLSAVTSVSEVCDGSLPGSPITVPNLKVVYSNVNKPNQENGNLFINLPKENVVDVNLNNSSLIVKKEVSSLTVSGSQLVTPTADENYTYLPFSNDRYTLIYSDGTVEKLNSSQVVVDPTNSKFVTISGLSVSSATGVKLLSTQKKSLVTAKDKKLNRSNVLNVFGSKNTSSGIGTTTLNDGLTYSSVYGKRVQDEEISLDVPDVVRVLGVFASSSTSEPTLPSITLSNFNGPNSNNTDLILGEEVTGTISNAKALVIVKTSSNTSNVQIVYENKKSFITGEVVTFAESGVSAVISSIGIGDKDITEYYDFDNGQRETFYDYGRIVRKGNFSEPNRRLKIVFQNYKFNPTDIGDIITPLSYSNYDFGKDIPKFNSTRNSDILDLRSRVSEYDASSTYSPFDFSQRNLTSSGSYNQNILSANESITVDFTYYLPRIDKIFLDKSGIFQLSLGQSSDNPIAPPSIDGAMEIAEIYLPAYLYDINDVDINLIKHKKYTMKDIGNIDQRLSNVEYYTSLSLLEQSVSNLVISDTDGLTKYKSGFFVDNFSSRYTQQPLEINKNSIDIVNNELRPSHYTTSLDLLLGSSSLIGIGAPANPDVDLDYATDLQDTNIKKTGDLIHLSYSDVSYLSQSNATKSVEITPFKIDYWQGSIELSPSSEVWIDQKILKIRNSDTRKIYNLPIESPVSQIGFSDGIWKDWEHNWKSPLFSDNDTIRSSNRDVIPLLRSRNIEFNVNDLKPYTRVYPFFDNVDVSNYCTPKLIEVTMESGVFQVGETVFGGVDNFNENYISFRLAQANHKSGPYNAATETYANNPYDRSVISSSYTTTSNLLNVDTYSLSHNFIAKYYGKIESGMKLYGKKSGAIATVRNVQLVTDQIGDIIGSFYVPNPNNSQNPKFESGVKTFRLTSSQINAKLEGLVATSADRNFSSIGLLENYNGLISTRNINYARNGFADINNFISSQKPSSLENINSVVTANNISISRQTNQLGFDPLAQTFQITEDSGVFVTKLDLYFESFDSAETRPVVVQIRSCEYGIPTKEILPFSEVQILPSSIISSKTANSATTVNFKAPVYLEGGKQYALILYSQASTYKVWASTLGESDVTSGAKVSKQSLNGYLYYAQNVSTWNYSPQDTLKFTLYRADFGTKSGTVNLYNPDLDRGNGQIPLLRNNPIEIYSKRVKIGTANTFSSSTIYPGVTIKQSNNSNAYGKVIGVGGSSTGSLSLINSGIGYTPAAASFVYNNVSLTTITGSGYGALANVTINNGVAIAATIVSGGYGYVVGDVVGLSSIGISGLGYGARFSVGVTTGNNLIILDSVQGQFNTVGINTLTYLDGSGTETIVGTGVTVISITEDTVYDGKTIKVLHENHGMYSSQNKVEIFGIEPDVVSTTITASYSSTSTSDITITDGSSFQTFENVSVASTNPGYALIQNEIIKYTGVSGNTLTGISRGIDSTIPYTYASGTSIVKYELGGISLRRINTTHSISANSIKIDEYKINIGIGSDSGKHIDRSVDSAGLPLLGFNESKFVGGNGVKASQNIVFTSITPNIQTIIPNNTNIQSLVKTVSATSPSGSEISFSDNGFSFLNLKETTSFNSPRLIASKINESNNLSTLPGNKSFNLRLNLSTNDPKVSPIIDLDRSNCIFSTNRIDAPVSNFQENSQISTLTQDPHSAIYVTKVIKLKNPANSLKVIFDLDSNSFSDIRVMYATTTELSGDLSLNYQLFPGYDNLDENGKIINPSLNSGRSDKYVNFDDDISSYKEVEYNVSDISDFLAYSIKIIMSGTNMANVPKIKNLKTIAIQS